ncbi:MAG TPA: energy transducer TonB [Bacteroidota bacterium]|nr:energy transducer TonB [Bacteroidota bacterium]
MRTLSDGALQTGGYGAAELSKFYPRSMAQSLILSIALQIALLAAFDASRELEQKYVVPDRPQRHVPGIQIQFPIDFKGILPLGLRGPVKGQLGPNLATPVPVPFDDPGLKNPFDRSLFGGRDSGAGGEGIPGGGWPGGAPQPPDLIPEPNTFVAVEKLPEPVKQVEPAYPVVAIKAGVEGTVTVQVYVGTNGRVRKAVVLRTSEEMLNSAALAAASQWVFTPALMNRSPVGVWVSIPFRFKLHRL